MHDEHCDLVCLELPRAEALRGRRLPAERAQRVASAAHALADPTRLTVAALLYEGGELCVCDLAWLTGRATNLVSHHLKALRLGGCDCQPKSRPFDAVKSATPTTTSPTMTHWVVVCPGGLA